MNFPTVKAELVDGLLHRVERDARWKEFNPQKFLDENLDAIQQENPHVANMIAKFMLADPESGIASAVSAICVYRALRDQYEVNQLEAA